MTLLQNLDRTVFEPTLVLMRREGVLLSEAPADVPVIDLKAQRLRSSWFSLAKLLRRTTPDILFSTSSGGSAIASFAHFLSRSKSRLVLSRRNILKDHELATVTGKIFLPFLGMLYRRADSITAVSHGVAKDLESLLQIPPSTISVIYNPLPDDILQPERRSPSPHAWFEENIPVLLAVGRLVEQKGYPMLLEAFGRVRRNRPVRLIILGEGELEDELKGRCATLGIAEDVCFAGWVPNPTAYMRRSTMFVLASKWEGLCTALQEALGSGMAAVATDCHAGPSELITSGENGILVPNGDAGAMALAIEQLLDDDSLRNRLGENASLRARAFSAPTIVAHYEDALLNGRRLNRT